MFRRVKLTSMGVLFGVAIVFAFILKKPWHWTLCLAIALSWLGDVLLARFDPFTRYFRDPFVPGMGAFALAQIAYIATFWISMNGMPALHMKTPGMYQGWDVLGALLPVYLLLGLLYWVWMIFRADQPTDLKIAVLVYCLLLCTMAGFASAASFTGTFVAWPLIAGGILFMISDAFIAAHLFAGKLPSEKRYDLCVWGTYLPAQILLFIGTSWLY